MSLLRHTRTLWPLSVPCLLDPSVFLIKCVYMVCQNIVSACSFSESESSVWGMRDACLSYLITIVILSDLVSRSWYQVREKDCKLIGRKEIPFRRGCERGVWQLFVLGDRILPRQGLTAVEEECGSGTGKEVLWKHALTANTVDPWTVQGLGHWPSWRSKVHV